MQGAQADICAMCCETYDQTSHLPLRLDCGHAICSTCFNYAYTTEARVICPRCSTATFTNQHIPDYTIVSYLKARRVQCSKCGRNTAVKYCMAHDQAHCAQCGSNDTSCKMMDLSDEDFNLRHHLYKRIKEVKEACKELSSDLSQQLATLSQSTNQSRLNLLTQLLLSEMHQTCFYCHNNAGYFHTPSLSLCCENCGKKYPGLVPLRMNSREELIGQIKGFIMNFLATVGNSFFDPMEAKMRSVFKALENPSISALATSLWRLRRMRQSQRDYSSTNYIQCPMCFEVFYYFNLPMVRLPCRNVSHFICPNCYQKHRENLRCPFDGSVVSPAAVITRQLSY